MGQPDEKEKRGLFDAKNDDDSLNEPPKKIPKLVDPQDVDFTSSKFAVKVLEDETTVAYATDESEVSSLNSEENALIRKCYNKLVSKEITSKEQLAEREIMIEEIKAQLRVEESRLCILKKLREVQRIPSVTEFPPSTSLQQTNKSNVSFKSRTNVPVTTNSSSSSSSRPALVDGTPVQLSKPAVDVDFKTNQQLSHKRGSAVNFVGRPLHTNNQSQPQIAGSKPSDSSSSSQRQPSSVGVKQQDVTPQALPLLTGRPSAVATNSTASISKPPSSSYFVDQQQTHAAAKLALRKQLEKTLLQIPHPSPPPTDLNFIPNPGQPEFLTLLGLDEIVERIIYNKLRHLSQKTQRNVDSSTMDSQNGQDGAKEEATKENAKPVGQSKQIYSRSYGIAEVYEEPLSCSQCSVNFTPTWKTENGRIKCEQCYRNNKKKALKVEHTNRLKQAFVKALEQEQELERRIGEGAFNVAAPLMPTSNAAVSATRTTLPSQANDAAVVNRQKAIIAAAGGHSRSSPAVKQSLPQASSFKTTSGVAGATSSSRSGGSSASASSRSVQQHGRVAPASSLPQTHQSAYQASQLMANLNCWNIFAAAANAARYPHHAAAQQAAAAAVLAAAAAQASPQTWAQNVQNLPADLMRTFQQLQEQQMQQRLAEAMIRPVQHR